MSSLTVALNRTVLPSHRGAMNGLVALGGSAARAVGPIFSGALIACSLSSSFIPPRIGAFVMFFVIGLLGSMVASLTYFILHEDDEDDDDINVAQGKDEMITNGK
jgi:MFS family permease